MLSVDEALALVLEHARPLPAVETPLLSAHAMTLAEDIESDVDSPPHDKAIVDGYAVLAHDLASGEADLEVLEEIVAGALPTRAVSSGKTSRVMTGAPLPPGADAMVMIEHSRLTDAPTGLGHVHVTAQSVKPGMNIMRRGASMRRGETVLAAGIQLRAIEIGVLAEVGRTAVRVIAQPTISVLATGDELVPVSVAPGPGYIRNSNGPLLLSAADRAGAKTVDLGIGRDQHAELADRIAVGLQSDILVLSGGVSAGVLDLVPGVLQELGVREVFHKVNLKPGKPLWFGVFSKAGRDRLVFGLPGNPVSSLVCFELFVRPAISQLAGRPPLGLRKTTARLAAEHVQHGDRPTYHPAKLLHQGAHLEVMPLTWRGSGDLRTLVQADALAYFPAGNRTYAAGEMIDTYLL